MTDFLGLAWPDGRVCVLCLAEKEHTEHVPVAERAHPDAGDATRNHYDWFFPNGAPDGLPESWLADIEAKMVEGLSDPFVDDAARIMLVLIAEVRRLRAAPPTDEAPCGDDRSLPEGGGMVRDNPDLQKQAQPKKTEEPTRFQRDQASIPVTIKGDATPKKKG